MAPRLSVFAGAGGLVPEAIAAARAHGFQVQVLSFTPRDDLADVKVVPTDAANPVKIIWNVKTFGTTHILMAGAIQLSDRTREVLAGFLGAFGRGNRKRERSVSVGDQSLSRIAGMLETITGAKIVGIHEIAPNLLAPLGHIAGPEPDAGALEAADYALGIAREIGRLDIGQAVVVSGRRVLAVEDLGGTDELLERIAAFRSRGLVGDSTGSRLVLAKARKPEQPAYADLPTIGPQTIHNAARAGIGVVAVEAEHSLLIDRAALAEAASAASISVIGRVVSGS
jgi:DUF1009 family protein